MSYPSWLHCNKCGAAKSENENLRFGFSNCGHVLCIKCLSNASAVCPVCKKTSSFMPLEKLRPDVKIFFEDPRTIANRFTSELKRAMEFQRFNKGRLETYLNSKANHFQKVATAQRAALKGKPTVEQIVMARDRKLDSIHKESEAYVALIADLEKKIQEMEVQVIEQEARIKQATKGNAMMSPILTGNVGRRPVRSARRKRKQQNTHSSHMNMQIDQKNINKDKTAAAAQANARVRQLSPSSMGSLFSSLACSSSTPSDANANEGRPSRGC